MNGWTARTDNLRFRIERWPGGFCLFVFRNGETVLFRDELQDTFEIATAGAEEDFGVSRASWIEEEWPNSVR